MLVERFDFEFFVGFANVIDPFIGRSFGAHLDVNSEEDRQFVDRIHARDESEMLAGRIKPTHAMAVMRKRPFKNQQHWKNMTPEFCVRTPELGIRTRASRANAIRRNNKRTRRCDCSLPTRAT